MKTLIKIAVIIVCLGLILGLALCLTACNKDDTNNKYGEGLSFGYINAKDCENGNIHEDKIKSDMQFELGNTYYMVIDFAIQAERDNGGTDRLHTNLQIMPAEVVEATIQDAATSETKEEVVNGKININLSYKIPESTETIKQTRLIIQLRPVLSSDIKIKLSFESENNLNAVTTTSVEDVIVGDYTQGLRYTKIGGDGYSVSKGVVGNQKQIVIPAFKDDRYVTKIGDDAFKDCSSLTNISIPDSVTSIGNDAFLGCSSLKYNEYSNGLYLGNYNNPYFILVKAKDKNVTTFEINGNTKVIHSGAFSNCSSLSNITIPNGITYIGNDAFSNCGSLIYNEYSNGLYVGNDNNPYLVLIKAKDKAITSFEINDKTKFIHSEALYNCSSLTTIAIPNQVLSIGSCAFQNCSSLKNVIISDSVISIGDNAFDGCTGLNNITCPTIAISYVPKNRLQTVIITSGDTISDSAFQDCSSLTNITIPNSLTSIGNYAFSRCSSLIYNEYDNGLYVGNDINPYLVFVKSKDRSITSFEINGKTKFIHSEAFYGCRSITSLTIPDSVTSIGDSTFDDCYSLTSITCPAIAISYIPKDRLQTVIITSGETIGDLAFDDCRSLTNITIPNSITSIGDNAFTNCSSLKYNEYNNGLYLGNADNPYLLLVKAKDKTITSFEINSKTKFIHSNAFYSCHSLKSITIPNSVKSIGSLAFEYCSSLTSVTIPNSVTSIGSHAFYCCDKLKNITIPGSVTYIGDSAFFGCPLKYNEYDNGLYIGSKNNPYLVLVMAKDINISSCKINRNTKFINGAFGYCRSLTNLTIPKSVMRIGSGSFTACTALTSITIPDSVTSIGSYAFSNCSSLTSVTIPDSVTSIGEDAFDGCYRLVEVYNLSTMKLTKGSFENGKVGYYALDIYTDILQSSKLTKSNEYVIHTNGDKKTLVAYIGSSTEITIPNRITSIGNGAFYRCSSLRSITIPNSVTSIGSVAFEYCSSLTSITIPNSVTSIGRSAFSNCKSLISITLPNSIKSIGNYALDGCSSLTSITIPNSVTSIGESAFSNCSSLTNVTIPNSVILIGRSAFYNCSSLTSIMLPKSVTSIGGGAFSNCNSLAGIDFDGTKSEWNVIPKNFSWKIGSKIKVVHCTDGDVAV